MKSVYGLIIVLSMVSCNRIKTSDGLDKEAIIREVGTMLDNYHKDIAKEGLRAEFKYLDRSPDFFWVPPGYTTALTYDSVRSILETNATAFRSITFHWDTLKIFPLSDEIVNYSGIVRGAMVDTSGTRSKISIIESGTIIKRKEGWKLLSGQSAVLNTESEQ